MCQLVQCERAALERLHPDVLDLPADFPGAAKPRGFRRRNRRSARKIGLITKQSAALIALAIKTAAFAGNIHSENRPFPQPWRRLTRWLAGACFYRGKGQTAYNLYIE